MTSFPPHLIRFFLTSFVILPFLIFLVKIHPWMFLLPIIHRTHKMSVCHLIAVRTNLSFWIHPICHLFFPEIQRVEIFFFDQPLCMIHQIMRMSMHILNFLIVVVMISSLTHSITMLIHLSLIFLSHRYLMKYMLMKWKPLKLSRHFSPSWWLCQVLVALKTVPPPIINLLNDPRLLITLLFSLKINMIYKSHILHQNITILSLMYWRSHT